MGLLSKIFKPFKKIVRKVGNVIKSVSKIVTKPLKAIMKPIGKFFSKLGPIGTIALSFILPGIGGVLGSWLQGAGTAFQGLFQGMPRIFNAIGKIGTAINKAATWGGDMYGKTIGKVFESISGAIKGGVNALTNGKSAEWGNWLSEFTNNISYKGEGYQRINADGTLSAFNDVVGAATEATNSITTTYDRLSTDPTELDTLRDTAPKVDPITVPVPIDERGPVRKSIDWIDDKWTGIKQSTAGRAYSMYNTANDYFADDPRLRMPGAHGASAFTMLGSMGNDFGSQFSFSQFDTAPINNAPTFIDTLQKYITGAFGAGYEATIIPRHDPLGFANGFGGYGYTTENALQGGGDD